MNAAVNLRSGQLMPVNSIYQALSGVRQAHPGAGMRRWSHLLALPEASLQVSRIGYEKVRPLQNLFSLFYTLPSLGRIKLVVFHGQESTVCEHRYDKVDLYLDDPHQTGLCFSTADTGFCVLLDRCYWACAVEEEMQSGVEKNLQFFNQAGSLCLKILATRDTDHQAWAGLVQAFAAEQDGIHPLFLHDTRKEDYRCLTSRELHDFEQAWCRLSDERSLYTLLHQYQLSYFNAVCELGPRLARPVSPFILETLVRRLSLLPNTASHCPSLSCSFYGDAAIQHLSGKPVVRRQGERLLLLWAQGHMLLDDSSFGHAFVVRRPQGNGWVSSLEIFDLNGEHLLCAEGKDRCSSSENLAIREIFNGLL